MPTLNWLTREQDIGAARRVTGYSGAAASRTDLSRDSPYGTLPAR